MSTAIPGVLGDVLRERGDEKLYPCIGDLVRNGLDPARFAADEPLPNRQALTHYLAAWSRHAGLTEEESGAWMVEYCCTRLASISKRTPAAIRHSTHGVLRYTYRSEVPFFCECSGNPFRAECRTDCPVHESMQARLRDIAEGKLPAKVYYRPPVSPESLLPVRPVKEEHRAQFEEGMRVALEEFAQGVKPGRILEHLRERGFKTRTGRAWTSSALWREVSRARRQPPMT